MPDRIKYRIRWYGDLWGYKGEPVLEKKIKNGLLGQKESYPLKEFVLKKDYKIKKLSQIIDNSNIPNSLKLEIQSLTPTLLNRYSRTYFQSVNKNFRITLDNHLSYFQINNNNGLHNKIVDNENVILELKYDKNYDDKAYKITNEFPFRLTKSSKYVTGLSEVYFH